MFGLSFEKEVEEKASCSSLLQKSTLSREDIRFLQIAESSAKLQGNHYTLKLPFKKENVYLPNNFSVAKQQILGLKRIEDWDSREMISFIRSMHHL